MPTHTVDHANLPYRIAVLCYLYDADDRVLMLHRCKPPNQGMHSPIGGKLEVGEGESPHDCAAREIHEEAGLVVAPTDLRLSGMVSEKAYEGRNHWLIFLYEVTRPIPHDEIGAYEFDEGTLEWIPIDDVETCGIPETDRRVMWPLVRQHRGGFFVVHIDCTTEPFTWAVRESHLP